MLFFVLSMVDKLVEKKVWRLWIDSSFFSPTSFSFCCFVLIFVLSVLIFVFLHVSFLLHYSDVLYSFIEEIERDTELRVSQPVFWDFLKRG